MSHNTHKSYFYALKKNYTSGNICKQASKTFSLSLNEKYVTRPPMLLKDK